MSSELTREQVIDLYEYLGSSKIINKEGKDDIQVCCTVHGESNPSMGFSLSKQICHCLSCHFSGDVRWLVYKSLPDQFKNLQQVDEFLLDRYGLNLNKFDIDQVKNIKRYEDHLEVEEPENRVELPLKTIAPFKSGKETYEYFYDRGFTKQTIIDFKIGRDLVSQTVTVPIFYEDNKLCGVIGRYINPNRRKNERYKIYEGTLTGDILFPMNKITKGDSLILVEGLLDSLWLHQLGFTNSGALLTNKLSKEQAEWIKDNFKSVIDMTDNDEMGVYASNSIKKRLGHSLVIYTVKHAYPYGKKDPQDCSKEEIEYMLENKKNPILKKLRRI